MAIEERCQCGASLAVTLIPGRDSSYQTDEMALVAEWRQRHAESCDSMRAGYMLEDLRRISKAAETARELEIVYQQREERRAKLRASRAARKEAGNHGNTA